MSEYEKMRKDGWEPSGSDPEVYVHKDKDEKLIIHRDDPNCVKPYGWGTYKPYGADDNHQ